jgi:hypothetical protein
MRDYHYTVLVIGFALAFGILHLVRRDHIYIRQGLFWILTAMVSLLFAMWPYLIDEFGRVLGIAYPPTLFFLVAIIVLVVKALFGDIAVTKVRRDLRRLNQRIALLEAEHPVMRAKEAEAEAASAEPASVASLPIEQPHAQSEEVTHGAFERRAKGL